MPELDAPPKDLVLITGASRGLGAALAQEFAAAGHDLLIIARDGAKLETVASDLRQRHGVTVHTLVADLTEPGAADAVASYCRSQAITVGVLINNAALMKVGPFVKEAPQDTRAMIALNITAATELTRVFLPGLIERGRGAVINVSSLAGYQHLPECAVYSASKAYLSAFSDAIEAELKGTGVACHNVLLGPMHTDMLAGSPDGVKQLAGLNAIASDPATAAAVIYDGYVSRRRRFTAGWLGAAMRFGVSVLPKSVSQFILARLG